MAAHPNGSHDVLVLKALSKNHFHIDPRLHYSWPSARHKPHRPHNKIRTFGEQNRLLLYSYADSQAHRWAKIGVRYANVETCCPQGHFCKPGNRLLTLANLRMFMVQRGTRKRVCAGTALAPQG